jgi:hypothetical protein
LWTYDSADRDFRNDVGQSRFADGRGPGRRPGERAERLSRVLGEVTLISPTGHGAKLSAGPGRPGRLLDPALRAGDGFARCCSLPVVSL